MISPTTGYKLFMSHKLSEGLEFQNCVVMAPLTPRQRWTDYYRGHEHQSDSLWMHTEQHMQAWKHVVGRVHAKGGEIFLQLCRLGFAKLSSANEVVSASAIGLPGGRLRDPDGETRHPFSVPRALTTDEVAGVIEDFRKSAVLAKWRVSTASKSTVQRSCSNKRTDKYGGSIENRAQFLLELLDVLKLVYPADRIAVRLSPNGGFAGMGSANNYDQFMYAIEQLSKHQLAYVAILDSVGFGYHDKDRLVTAFDAKTAFKGTIIVNGDYTRDLGEGTLRSGAADLISCGRPYIANPDLVERFQNDWPLSPLPEIESWKNSSWGAKRLITWPTYRTPVTN